MRNNYPKVSIITVNFNGKKYLKKLFDSVFCLNYPKNKLEVIFVDNVSTDNSIEFMEKNYPKVKVIKNNVNNYCKAVNLGIETSKGKYLALINNDIRLDKNWLIELIKVISKDKSIAAVGSKILNMAGQIQNAAHYELPNFYWGERGAGQTRNKYRTLEEALSLCGAAVLYRKDALFEVGLFDQDFIIYGEDVDMSLRLRQKGYKLIFVPTSIIYHKFHGTANGEFARYYIERNRLLFLAKHYPHKLSSSLLGSGHFTAKASIDSCGKIYSIFPEVIMKLIKTHPSNIVREINLELFGEIEKIVNYENEILAKEINKISEQLHQEVDEVNKQAKEIEQKNNELSGKEKEIFKFERELEKIKSQLHSHMNEIFIKDSRLTQLNEQIQQHLNNLQAKEALLADRENELTSLKDELSNISNQLRQRMDEVLLKDGQITNLNNQITQLNEQNQQHLSWLQAKEALLADRENELTSLKDELSTLSHQLAERQRDLTNLKDELNNISNQLRQRMEEILLKDGEIIEKKVEIDTLKKELFGLAEQLADNLVTIKENKTQLSEKEKELATYKNELQNLSTQLRSRMDEILLKDSQLFEKDNQITQLNEQIQQHLNDLQAKEALLAERENELTSLKDELNNISNQLRQRMDEVLLKDGEIIEKEGLLAERENELTSLKDQLNNISNQLRQRIDEVLLKDGEIICLKDELNGIYNSEGFRFVLRPLWTVIWHMRRFLKAVGIKLTKAFWLSITIMLTPVFLFLSLSFFLEYISWVILRPLLKRIVTKRKIEPIEDIKISLVMPNYNGIDCLRKCLPSIFSAEGFAESQNEVLIVDDGSTDGSVDFIKTYFPQVRLIQNRRNKGFGFTCNRGVKTAKNEIIVLINNDIILTKDFLKPLINHLQKEDVFAVTPKLYGWDRKTFVWGMHMGHFENGYIRLWNEAETGNGDRINQTSPSIFAIGGAMVFRKSDFLWLGGFNEIYRPNCWEDIDISYRAWKRGLKVLYEPSSLMYHKGRATLTYERPKEIKNELSFTWRNITDLNILRNHLNLLPYYLYTYKSFFLSGFFWALRYLPKILIHRFKDRKFEQSSDKEVFNRTMLYYRNFMKNGFQHSQDELPNVLIISRIMPYPLNMGGKIRIHTLAKLLNNRYNISLLTLIDHEDELRHISELKKVFKEVYTVLAKSPLKIKSTLKLLYPSRYRFSYSYSQELVEKLKEIQKNKPLDLIQIESNELLYLTDYIKHLPIIYTEHDISILTFGKSYYQRNTTFISSILDYLKRFYFHTCRYKWLDKVITLSKEDEEVLRAFFPTKDVALVPTGVDLEHFSFDYKGNKSKKLVFVGHYLHYPNEDAIVYFSTKVFPLIRRRMPDVQLVIVGSNPTPRIEELARQENITLVGTVEDVKPYLSETSIFVNYVRFSAGIKGKVLEPMATGTPVVSTTIGSYGIDARSEKEILIADTPREFSRAIIRLFEDDELHHKLAVNARRLVEEKYNWRKISDRLDKVYRSTLFTMNGATDSETLGIEQILDRTKDLVERKIEQLNGAFFSPERGPEELHIELTYRCNSRCIMCDLWDYQKREWNFIKDELSFEEIKRFVNESRYLQKTKVVVLSGGEPFFRKDIVELCGFFSKWLPNGSINILTNGLDTNNIVSKTKEILDKFQPKSLWLGSSLDGLGEQHDRIRGTEGAFSALQKTIERCKKELPAVRLSTTFTLTPYNINQLVPVKQFADREGLDFFAQFVVPKPTKQEFVWTEAKLIEVENMVREIMKRLIGDGMDYQALLNSFGENGNNALLTQLYYWSHLVKYQRSPQRFFKKCVAGYKFAMFTPYGDLFLCPLLKDKVTGNIRKEKFDRLWMSKKTQELREFIEKEDCHCWLVCIIFPLLDKALGIGE